MIELHNTVMGRRLIEHDIPEIHHQLKRIGDLLENKEQKNPAVDFLEQLEAATTDKNTAFKIRKFLIQQGIWSKQPNLAK